ncbi:MAG TPA: dolichyl-phosphate beta-glucosyltransferase [Vicinamibacterales bacterium]|nr:dolichyl-phosphate beta-glucosyltransferase [Vicinamibacterales bacterium]
MASPVRLSVVIPAMNEAERIGDSLRTLQAQLPESAQPWEIRVVDDGSTDRTAEIVAEAAAADPRIVLQREPHRGKGGALRAGLLAARGELRFMCDADLSMPVSELPKFLAAVPAECDLAIGSREGPGARRVGEPGHRHTMGRVFNVLVRLTGLAGIEDTQCGFKLFSARAAELIVPRLTLDGWAIDIEMLVIAARLGLRVREVPIEWHYRERSRISPILDSIRMSRDVLRIRLNLMRRCYDIDNRKSGIG